MEVDPSFALDLRAAGFSVDEHVPLSSLGSFRLGGPARMVVSCSTPAEMARLRPLLRDASIPAVLIGEGTNLLFADAGWPGLLVRAAGGKQPPTPAGPDRWRVPAALSLEELASWAVSRSRSGLEPFIGIPGSVGGGVAGNAGAWGVQFADILLEVSGWDPEGHPFRFPVADCGFSYRDSRLKQEGFWISEVTLHLPPGDADTLRAEQNRILAERAARHPDWRRTPCIGSFFKNLEPTSSAERRRAAGWFLEEAGAKSCRVGGAAVYPGHANILVKAEDTCRSADVAELARSLQDRVERVHGIRLHREVRYLGRFPDEPGGPGFH